MNNQVLPWVRQITVDGKSRNDLVVAVGSALVAGVTFVICVGIMSWAFVGGIDKQAQIDRAYADGESRGRMLLMQQVADNLEREDKAWNDFIRHASKPGGNGFDAVVLMAGEKL